MRAPLEASALEAAFRGAEVVVHLAGVPSAVRPQTYTEVNVEGVRAVATAARQAGARLIHISSLAAAGPAPARAPRHEDDPPDPITPYGRSKLAGEGVVASTSGLRWTILRPAVVYGPGDRALLPVLAWRSAESYCLSDVRVPPIRSFTSAMWCGRSMRPSTGAGTARFSSWGTRGPPPRRSCSSTFDAWWTAGHS